MTSKLTHIQRGVLIDQRNLCTLYIANELKYHINCYLQLHSRERLRTRIEHARAIGLFRAMLEAAKTEYTTKQIYREVS